MKCPDGENMKDLIHNLLKVIPEGMQALERRHTILKTIYYQQPIGRRALSSEVNLSERVIRSEIDFLKEQEFIQISSAGMAVTVEGIEMLDALHDLVHELRGLYEFEEKIRKALKVNKVIIVPGNADEEDRVKKELGKEAAKYFSEIVKDSTDIAITGGSTIARFVEAMTKKKMQDVVVVPARGSVGNEVEYQANTLAASLASKIGGQYKNFSIPDNLSRKAMDSMLAEKEIQEVVQHMKKAQILICGIGNAISMAEKRNLPKAIQEFLERKKAVSEAFGYYFSQEGEMVYISRSIGIKLEDVKQIEHVIAIAGGGSKAKSIAAAPFLGKNSCLIIDEGAAVELEKLFTNI